MHEHISSYAVAKRLTTTKDHYFAIPNMEDVYPLVRSIMAWLPSHNSHHSGTHILVFSKPKDIKQLQQTWKLSFAGDVAVCEWPQTDYWGEQSQYHPELLIQKKMRTLSYLRQQKPCIILTTPTALHEHTTSSEDLIRGSLHLHVGMNIDPKHTLRSLLSLGYSKGVQIRSLGDVVTTGENLEIYAPGYTNPIRIIIRESTILSIKAFSQRSGRSLENIEKLSIYAADEYVPLMPHKEDIIQLFYDHCLETHLPTETREAFLEALHNDARFAGFYRFIAYFRHKLGYSQALLKDHLKAQNCYWWHMAEQTTLKENLEAFTEAYKREQSHHSHPTISPEYHYAGKAAYDAFLQACHVIYTGPALQDSSPHTWEHVNDNILSPLNTLNPMVSAVQLKNYLASNQDGVFDLATIDERIRTRKDIQEIKKIVLVGESAWKESFVKELAANIHTHTEVEHVGLWDIQSILTSSSGVLVAAGHLPKDVLLASEGIHWIPGTWFGWNNTEPSEKKHQREQDNQKDWQEYLRSLSEIAPGDLVVHREHGVGRFVSLTKLAVRGDALECLQIMYSGGDKIYLPVENISLLQKYGGSGGTTKSSTVLDSLSKNLAWKKRKAKVKSSLRVLAEDILKVHSRRELKKLKPYSKAPESFVRFVQDFPHMETEDQLRFQADMEEDFVSYKAMDRLLIGDVGFGKTEMAMRAAMRTVLEGYQVMVLCPTTVLSYQHAGTFRRRMQPYNVEVAWVSRFVKPKALADISQRFSSGKISILIGTHKLLSKIFQPAKLGLVIIDEEQRFGVAQKEKIKALRAEAAVLALSATPIPRTLHMSMLGLRDISLLTTPPEGRLAIKNQVMEWNDELISTAIQNELKRGGQVFFVHNRVKDIEAYASAIKELVPHAQVRIAHGGMNEETLEKVLVDFVQGVFSILVCTTIMESGVDMPNVNTIFIHQAHMYGLSQLYQIRGRVGRSGVQAYAYFITPPKGQLSDEAKQRMQVISMYQALGSGFSIASYDMDLRGAGDILGGEQSGHIATVGIEMYTQMLSEAIAQARGEVLTEEVECDIHISLAYGIPSKYLTTDSHRLKLYKHLFLLKTHADIDTFAENTEDRYGRMPQKIQNLFQVAALKISLKKLAVKRLVEVKPHKYELYIPKIPDNKVDYLLSQITHHPKRYSLASPHHIHISLPTSTTNPLQLLTQFTENLISTNP